MHQSVLLNEVLHYMEPQKGAFIVDGTANGGGHAMAISELLGPKGKLLALDWDCELLKKFESRINNKELRIVARCANYAELPEILREEKLGKADGLLLDLGFSSEQIEGAQRGFSFQKDEPLDMRYNLHQPISAYEAVNTLPEKELTDMFWKFGEERFAGRVARAIVEARRQKPIRTTAHLAEVIAEAMPPSYRRHKIHPATKVFQALRIYVNNELGNLERALESLSLVLKRDGRVVVISFHSLEDRMVKNYFRDMKKSGTAELLTKKPVTATEEEIARNPRARSAKLRAIRMCSLVN